MARVLKVSSEKMRDKIFESLEQYMTTMAEQLPALPDRAAVRDRRSGPLPGPRTSSWARSASRSSSSSCTDSSNVVTRASRAASTTPRAVIGPSGRVSASSSTAVATDSPTAASSAAGSGACARPRSHSSSSRTCTSPAQAASCAIRRSPSWACRCESAV